MWKVKNASSEQLRWYESTSEIINSNNSRVNISAEEEGGESGTNMWQCIARREMMHIPGKFGILSNFGT